MLEVHEVTAGYGSFEVLHAVSLEVPAHQVVALLGHNGAGKSTLLKTIYGQLPARAGRVLLKGVPTMIFAGLLQVMIGVALLITITLVAVP